MFSLHFPPVAREKTVTSGLDHWRTLTSFCTVGWLQLKELSVPNSDFATLKKFTNALDALTLSRIEMNSEVQLHVHAKLVTDVVGRIVDAPEGHSLGPIIPILCRVAVHNVKYHLDTAIPICISKTVITVASCNKNMNQFHNTMIFERTSAHHRDDIVNLEKVLAD